MPNPDGHRSRCGDEYGNDAQMVKRQHRRTESSDQKRRLGAAVDADVGHRRGSSCEAERFGSRKRSAARAASSNRVCRSGIS